MSDFVGYCTVDVHDSALAVTFPVLVFYPTSTPGQVEKLGSYPLNVALDAPLKAGPFPLILISHGTGSTPLVYRSLAYYLAQNGFVVGLPEHPFNNRDNDAWAGTMQNLAARPRHIPLTIDHFFDEPRFAPALKPASVGLIGHSLGGYTVLALAGGQPMVGPPHTPDGQWHAVPVPAPDPRVAALVLLAPAVSWFSPAGTLRQVRLPILLLVGEKDEHIPPTNAQIVLRGVPDLGKVQHRVVANAGHFSFLSPFPKTRVSPAFPPSQDPPGFDREHFHAELNAEVLAFLRREV
ncbi:alpha/beta hydrolase family protein [Hymenobacter cavernae]|uniref:Alpha/beta hydrolase n=1 Tax=Hymenobacter cavernae TaxID=2044852 RepID=A0ABQ1UL75_9BACT|nr:hypothetical protein [Hymenobacter cavernae]GGF21770.1 hypothetical protein GCM10011383_36760 [Hymenobacter cavernae]